MSRNKEGGNGKVFSSFIFGAFVGAVAALLFTPKSGNEIRGNLNRQTISLKKKSTDFASKAKEKSSSIARTVSDSSMVNKVKNRTNRQNSTGPKAVAQPSAFPKDYDDLNGTAEEE